MIAPEGAIVRAGAVLAWIGTAGESIPVGDDSTDEVPPASVAGFAPEQDDQIPLRGEGKPGHPIDYDRWGEHDLGFISPVVKRIAAEHAIDLYQVQGSGQGGRITKKDVLAYIEAGC